MQSFNAVICVAHGVLAVPVVKSRHSQFDAGVGATPAVHEFTSRHAWVQAGKISSKNCVVPTH